MLKSFEDYKNFISAVLHQLADAAPGLKQNYYVGGTTPISCLDLQHAISFDLDLHTKTEIAPTSQESIQLKRTFRKKDARLEWHQADSAFGMYQGTLFLGNDLPTLSVDLFSNVESAQPNDIRQEPAFSPIPLVTPRRYLREKLSCLEERQEPKDSYHLFCLWSDPRYQNAVEQGIRSLDPPNVVLALEATLLGWPHERDKIFALPGLKPIDETRFRKWLLTWKKTMQRSREKNPPSTPSL